MASVVEPPVAPIVTAIRPTRQRRAERSSEKPAPEPGSASIPTEAVGPEHGGAPWLPVRYARPIWPAASTVTQPGASRPARTLSLGVFLSIHEEAEVDGARWYRTGGGDWIAADAVALLQPSSLRGVELDAGQAGGLAGPSPVRTGVVTADGLNIRSGPGTQHPVVSQAVARTRVSVFEQAQVDDTAWYRIGSGLWVHGAWVELDSAHAGLEGVDGGDRPPATSWPVGWVVADVLNVRVAPGATPENAVVDRLVHNQAISIVETAVVDGEPWHCSGRERWVAGRFVGVARPTARPAAIGAAERWVGVDLQQQTLIAYAGDEPVYAALISSGLPATPSPCGVFRTWWRLPACRMTGGAPGSWSYYYLEDVTWTCYFHGGYALHTAYWHDAFGRPRSHGCINLSPYDAWWLFRWSEAGGSQSPAVYTYQGGR